MTWSDHFRKNGQSYITLGAVLGAGLAGAALAYGRGDSTAEGFNTGLGDWELPQRVRVPIGGGVHVVYEPNNEGRSTGIASSPRKR